MRYFILTFLILLLVLILIPGCNTQKADLRIAYEKYTLSNGLEVALHEDKSDPITAVTILYHVGSNREEKGRTGFAHLFEHMLFQESQHVGQDQFFKKIQDAGGTLNGGTSFDYTIYFQVVPKNALEMVLWLESDRMGFLLSKVTQEAFINQQEVVMNEKRQRVDNQPYGHTSYIIYKLLYPEAHPYNWNVIGSMEDLANATLTDVRNFHTKWYGPNNATLVVAGDFDNQQTKDWIEKYFGEINAIDKVDDPKPISIVLDETKKAYHEDNFAKSPELNMVFPTVHNFTKDSYAIDMLAELLTDGKKAPLYKVIVEERKLAPSVAGFQYNLELAGRLYIRIRAFPNTNLTDVEQSILEAFNRFEEEGFTDKDVKRIKAKTETRFYNRLASILGKSRQLAQYNEFAGSPSFITQDLQNILDVTKDDIWRVYNQYVKEKPYVLTSFVPKGKVDLIAQNSMKFPVVEEVTGKETAIAKESGEEVKVEMIPTSFDRTIEPAKGPDPSLTIPDVWQDELSNGLKIYGIVDDELPLAQFSLVLTGGMLGDDMEKVGVANLMSDIMMEGTKNKTPIELEEAIDELGARINMYTTKETIVISANTLSSKFDATFALLQEILLEPRWDEKEFERVKRETIEQINRNQANPRIIATNVFNKLLYGNNNILSNSTYGSEESVNSIAIDDLKNFYDQYFSPGVSYLCIVGAVPKEKAMSTCSSLDANWPAKEVKIPQYGTPAPVENSKVYFVDVPNAKQSQIRIGYLSLPFTDADYYPAYVMNYKLGGSFSGIVNLILREEKGYTYGARTSFSGSNYPGPFAASSAVQSSATFESVKIFREEMQKYRNGLSQEDLSFTKNALIKSNAREFETLNAKMNMLNNIARYELPTDYVKEREEIVKNMTHERHKQLAQKYIIPDRMVYLVVGDAKTQLKPLAKLGIGKPVLIDKEGNKL
jgi:zinc protease